MEKLYPLKLKKVFKEKVWGGRNFRDKLNMDLPSERLYGESWEVSSDAKLIMGLKSGITPDIFAQKTKNKDFGNIFNVISVKKGDFINVTPGLIHASLEGSMVM